MRHLTLSRIVLLERDPLNMLPQNTGSNEEEEEKPSSSKEIVPVKLSEDNKIDEQTKAELLVLMQRYLAASCPEAAEVLKNELEKKNIIPPRYDITGQSRKRSFEEYVRLIPQAQPNLMDLMSHLNSLTNKYVPPVLPKLPLRIINSKRQSLTRNTESVKKLPVIEDILTQRPSLSGFQSLDCLKMLTAREMGTQLSSRLLLRKDCINNLDLHARILGHLSAVFCVAFDRTGRYIITGADDNLIKIWDAHKGILRCTLRGHAGEISDITVSHENTVLATGSTDKTVRVWCLQTGRVLQIYHCHTGTITSIAFLPYMVDEHRFLVSTGSDCRVCFYKWNGPKKEFPTIPYLFDERVTSGSRIVSSCHSPGGNLVVIGDTHHYIRIYQILEDNIEKIFEYHAHTDRVDSLVWSHSHLRFVSGSKDGTAKVWKFAAGHWTSVNLYPFLKIEEPARVRHPRLAPNGRGGLELTYTAPVPVQPTTNKKNSYKVTMLCWSLEDDFVISSGTDYVIRVWNWETGQVIKEMLGHENDAFVLTAHPIYKEFIFSAGHDGFVIVWDIYKGVAVKKNINTDAIGNDPIFDLCVSSDGTLVAFVDSQGHLSILGVGRNDRIRSYPKQQFFHTDYKPLFTDHNHYVVDADTGLAPHLMDPPIFCNADTIPHEQIFQRMIPGNDVIETNITQTLENSQSQSENPNIQELLSIGRTQSRCPWITRDIIQSYRESQLNKIYDERNCTTEEERKEFEKEKEKYDPEIEQRVLQSSQAAQSQRNQRGRGRPGTARTGISVRDIDQLFERLNQPVGRGRNRSLVDPIGQLSDPEDDNYTEHSHSGEDDSSEDETEDGDGQQDRGHLEEDDSDYEVGRPESSTVFRSRSNFTVTGRRKSRRNRNPEDSGPSSQQSTHHTSPRRRRSRVQPSRAQRSRRPREEQTSPERSRRSEGTKRTRDRSEKSTERKRIKAEKVEFDDPDLFTQSDPDVPSTSSGRAHRALARKSSQSGDEIKKTSKRHQAKKEPSSAHGPIIDFPMWMRKVQVRRFPYIAQLGDQVVYCLQGHQAYLNAVEEQRIYRIPREFDIRSDLNAEEFCIVDELEYRLKPYRTIVLKLAITDANGRRKKGEYINVMYHDMEGQPDFLILKQHYDLSLSYSFDSGSAVEAMIDDI
uniref:Uncharacterized protein n=1 Tax=Acrobeloides nanus TaxID=290746 RepID=A0A914BVI5_9BILA